MPQNAAWTVGAHPEGVAIRAIHFLALRADHSVRVLAADGTGYDLSARPGVDGVLVELSSTKAGEIVTHRDGVALRPREMFLTQLVVRESTLLAAVATPLGSNLAAVGDDDVVALQQQVRMLANGVERIAMKPSLGQR
jgi:hypothetical protein